MNYKKMLSGLFGLLGLALAATGLMLCFRSVDVPARIFELDAAAPERTEAWMEAVCAGDYETAGQMMYGQPELEPGMDEDDPVSVLFWEAGVDRLSYEFLGDCYPTRTGIARDVKIIMLDLPRVMELLRPRTEAVMEQRIEEWEYLDGVYDENNNYQDSFVMDSLREAAEVLLNEGRFITSRELTLNLIYEDGQWWVLPEQDLINTLSGKIK